MYFKILMGYILGYVTIEIEGYFIERFMNLCNNQKIFLWNLKRKTSTIMKVNVNISDFKKLKNIARKKKFVIKRECLFSFTDIKKEKYFFFYFCL